MSYVLVSPSNSADLISPCRTLACKAAVATFSSKTIQKINIE